jgi:3'-5' exoribonuclease 1
MRYIIVDLEATCWEGTGNYYPAGVRPNEIIEIGAVVLPSAASSAADEFGRFVRPVAKPELSDFCIKLTSITQADVDSAAIFPAVFQGFVNWIGPEPFVLCSWGQYDLNQFRADCGRHDFPLPATFERHVNVKKEFARVFKVRPCGMAEALKHAGLPLEGQHHRGIDDARNIAKLARLVLPVLEKEGTVPLP